MTLKTYQDFLRSEDKLKFVFDAITDYLLSPEYHWASEGDQYMRQKNTTITQYRKFLYTLQGKAVPDNYSANHKVASNFFNRFVTQEVQFLLGNGVNLKLETKERLGGSSLDVKLQQLAKKAISEGVAYGFWNFDHLEVFSALEFAPLYDEESGRLRAGIRFWQLSSSKPLRATLYEEDGYTDLIKTTRKIELVHPKKAYILTTASSIADGEMLISEENYTQLPIIPLWGNDLHQSKLVGLKEEIDTYDLIKSGFANDLDDVSQIYWIIQDAGGMDDIDLARFRDRLKTVKAAVVDGDTKAEAHTIDVPHVARETYLTRLENDLYRDAMALNANKLQAGNVTATAIRAAYEPLNAKADDFEYQVDAFLYTLMDLLGISDNPTFTRSMITNAQEITEMVLSAKEYLDRATILRHLPFLTPEEVTELLKEESTDGN